MSIETVGGVSTQVDKLRKHQSVPFRANSTNSLERNPQDDSFEKKGMSTGAKVALGTVAVAGALAAVDALFNKSRNLKKIFGVAEEAIGGGSAGSTGSTGSTGLAGSINFKNGKAYLDSGELFTGTVTRTSKSAHRLDSHYIDGVVVKREFIPVAPTNDITRIVKTYDTTTYPGVRIAKGEILKADGSKEYSFNAVFTQREFPPEIEAKIKMKDFFDTDLSKIKTETVDLGDGLILKYDARFSHFPECELIHNGNRIAKVSKFCDLSQYAIEDAMIYKTKDGLLDEAVFFIDEGHISFSPDGTSKLTQMFRLTDEGTRQLLPDSEIIIKKYDALGNLVSESVG